MAVVTVENGLYPRASRLLLQCRMKLGKLFLVKQHLMVYIRQRGQRQVRHQAMDIVVIRLVLLIAHIENGLHIFCQEHMRTNQHMISIDTQVVAAGTDLSAQLHKLLEQPPTTVPQTSVTIRYLQVQFLRTEAKDRILVHEPQTVFLTEAHNLVLSRRNDIDILNGVCHTTTNPLQTQRKDGQVFGNNGYHDINRLAGWLQLGKRSPSEQAVADFAEL